MTSPLNHTFFRVSSIGAIVLLTALLTGCHRKSIQICSTKAPSEATAQPSARADDPVEQEAKKGSPAASKRPDPKVPVIRDIADMPEPLVEITALDPSIVLDLRYATANNFMKRPVYKEARAFLRRDAAERLVRAQKRLQAQGLGLKIWDAYRPLSVQWDLWDIYPNGKYVANPSTYGSRHNRGGAVDITLIDAEGNELEMPTDYDDFSEEAASEYPGASPEALKNRAILQEAMVAEGYEMINSEWWHFDAPGSRDFPVLDIPIHAIASNYDAAAKSVQ